MKEKIWEVLSECSGKTSWRRRREAGSYGQEVRPVQGAVGRGCAKAELGVNRESSGHGD